MKKTFTTVIITMIICTSSLMAQKQLYFGLAGTGLSSTFTNQNNYGQEFEMDYKVTFGGSGNVNIGFDFSNHAGLKIEAGYSKLGQNYTDTYKDTVYTRDVQLNYMQLPLMFKFRTGGKAKFYVMAGPQFNFLLSAKQKYYKQGVIDTDSIYNPINNKKIKIGEETITDRYSSFDVMARLDLGVDILLGKNFFLNVGLTMAYGLLDINASSLRIPDHSSGIYHPSHNIYGGVNFGFNYVLPLGKKN
ncbi:MAG: porin family protein [bacterium]